jgi:peptidyl-prolyl cis-trans isomerase SurA
MNRTLSLAAAALSLAGSAVFFCGNPHTYAAETKPVAPSRPASPATTAPAAAAGSPVRRAALPAGYVDVEGVAAVVGDQIITLGELRRAQGSQQASQALVPTDADRPRSEAALRMQTLQSLVDNALVLHAAKELGLTAEEKEIDKQVEATRKKNGWTEDEMDDAVKRIGFASVAAYRLNVRQELLRMQMLRYKLGSKLRVTDDEVKKVIDQEHGGGAFEDEIHARHVLVTVPSDAGPPDVARLRDKAWKCYDEIAKGKTFEEVAADCSDDTGTGPGGDLGWQRRWTLDPTFANKLWSLKKGEMSQVIQTPFGFHIIQQLERRRAEVKDKEVLEQFIRARLSEEQFVRLYRAWIEELRAGTHIEVRVAG